MVSTSTTPILAASATDADDFMVGLTFEVRRAGTTTVLASGQSASAEGEQGTFQVPSGVLSNGDSFEFRVGAADMQTSTWSSWASGTIAVPTGQQMPTAVALTSCQGPCENWISDTANPTFTATRPGGSGSAGLVFEIRDGVGFDTTHEVLDVAPQSRATWSVPAGTLGVGGYDLRVGTRIADTTIWSAWYQFGIDPEVTDGADFPLSDAPQTNAETVPSDPNATPDPARDSADTGPVSTYGEADEDALDAKVALDEADATSAGLSRNTDSLSSRRVSIPLKYAPRAHIHPGEKDFPMSPDTFLNHSDVMWFGYACGKLLIDKTPEPVTLGGGGYTHKPTTGNDYCNGQGTLYRSDDNVRPGDEGNSIFQGQGMYLNLNNSYRDGQGFQGDEPVFYDYQPKKYLLYWFSWGNSYEKPPGVTVGTHEGDWERVAIKLDSNNDPRLVQYFYHYDSCTLKWGDAPRKGNRLNLWIAQHAHGVYPANAVTPGYKHAGYTYHDSISGDGPTWYASNNLDNVRTQDWFGYGGGWGEKYGHFGGQWGPLGPNSYHSNTPPTFSSNKCDVH
jgi:hypothetical protein